MIAQTPPERPVRGTQLLVEHISGVFRSPLLLVIEVAWRWLFGIPFLLVCWRWATTTLGKMEYMGLNGIDWGNPWLAATQLSSTWNIYAPSVGEFLRHLLLPTAIAWIAISGLGRAWLLMRLGKSVSANSQFRPATTMLLQAMWLGLWLVAVYGWYLSMAWVAATHINIAGEPDLIGYFIWAIFLSLGFFTIFALTSWPLSIAPVLALLDGCSALDALAQSFTLGKAFTSKLVEINLVMGIVKLALVVLAMVFSAAPLPFGDELGSGALRMISAASVVFYFVANDFFQVVRLKAFVEFWKVFRSPAEA